MTNIAGMTNTELQAALAAAVEQSNWHFDEQNWAMAEQWGLLAEELHAQLRIRDLDLEPCGV